VHLKTHSSKSSCWHLTSNDWLSRFQFWPRILILCTQFPSKESLYSGIKNWHFSYAIFRRTMQQLIRLNWQHAVLSATLSLYHFAVSIVRPNSLVRPRRGAEYIVISTYVCSSVCLNCLFICSFAYLSTWVTEKLHGGTSSNYRARCLRPWFGPPLAALRYVVHFRFCGWRHVFR